MDREVKDPRIPDWVAEKLANAGGRTLGGLPKVRVIHGENARGFPMPDKDDLKYLSPEDASEPWGCFILEEWMPPEFFGDPAEWERQRWAWGDDGRRHEIMAPFPAQGAYVFVQPLVAPNGYPFELSDQVVQYVEWLIETRRDTPQNTYTNAELTKRRIDAMREAQEEKRRETEARLELIAEENRLRTERVNAAETREYSLPSSTLRVTDRRANKGA